MKKKLLSSVLVVGMLLPGMAMASADVVNLEPVPSTQLSAEELVTARVESAIKSLNDSKDGELSFDKSQLTNDFVAKVRSMSDSELQSYLSGFYVDSSTIETRLISTSAAKVDEDVVSPMYKTYNDREAEVWTGIPSVGHTTLTIKYNMLIGEKAEGPYNGLFYGGRVTNSWQTGVALGQWRHLDGEVDHYGNQADVIARGLLTYGIKGTPLSYTAEVRVSFHDSIQNYK